MTPKRLRTDAIRQNTSNSQKKTKLSFWLVYVSFRLVCRCSHTSIGHDIRLLVNCLFFILPVLEFYCSGRTDWKKKLLVLCLSWWKKTIFGNTFLVVRNFLIKIPMQIPSCKTRWTLWCFNRLYFQLITIYAGRCWSSTHRSGRIVVPVDECADFRTAYKGFRTGRPH